MARSTVRNVAKLVTTIGLGAITAITPQSARPGLAERLTTAGARIRRVDLDRVAHAVGAWLPEVSRDECRAIAAEMRAVRIEQAMCRGYGVFRRGWPARITVRGIEHLHAAHTEGRGVIVWLMSFLDATPFNIIAAAAGHPVTHLSLPTHGVWGEARLSQLIFAPIVLRGELRSQGRRVLITRPGLDYVRDLVSVLESEHGTVTIRGDESEGRLKVEAPHLGGVASFPTGAPSLAHRTGAALLTTATIRRGPLDHEVVVDPPVGVSRGLDRRTFQREAVREYARRLDERVRTHPGSRPSWPFLASRPP